MNIAAVRDVVEDVVDALWATDPIEHLIVREGWPGASCENVSAAIAVVLEDRGFGRWTYVGASRPGESNSHAWLEWRNTSGFVQFSIDRTLEQFREWNEPFVGKGRTPAAAVFTHVHTECAIWDLPWMHLDVGQRLARLVREQLEAK